MISVSSTIVHYPRELEAAQTGPFANPSQLPRLYACRAMLRLLLKINTNYVPADLRNAPRARQRKAR